MCFKKDSTKVENMLNFIQNIYHKLMNWAQARFVKLKATT